MRPGFYVFAREDDPDYLRALDTPALGRYRVHHAGFAFDSCGRKLWGPYPTRAAAEDQIRALEAIEHGDARRARQRATQLPHFRQQKRP